MTERTQSGFSSAAVPMLTLVQPLPSARGSESSSLIPPDSSTQTSTAGSSVSELRSVIGSPASSKGLQPVSQQRGACVAGLLRVELGRGQHTPFGRRGELLAVLGPGNECARGGELAGGR